MHINELIRSAVSQDHTQIGTYCHRCYPVLNSRDVVHLRPMTVTKIVIPITGFNSEPRLLQIDNHLCDKPWRVLNRFIYLTKQTSSISIYLISPINRKIKIGENICHVRFIQPEEALYDIKGNFLLLLIIIIIKRKLS